MKDYLLKSSFALFIFTSSYLIAEPDFYGKINVSYENAKKSSVQDTGFENNASRLGVKGKFNLIEGIKLMARQMVKKFSKKEILLLR
jgi:hypothetical protein